MIKKLVLNYKSSNLNKKHVVQPVSYSKASTVGIIYNEAEFGKDTINRLFMELTNDQKKVARICLTKDVEPTNNSFLEKEVSFTGAIKNEYLQKFIQQPFDIVISLCTAGNHVYDYILSQTKAKLRVSLATPEGNAFADLEVKPTTTTSAIKDLMTYLKKVEHD